MRTVAWPETVQVAPGDAGSFSVTVTNGSGVIDAYHVQVFGLDPSWVDIEPARLSLFPGDTANVEVSVRLPADYPASRRTLTINVSSEDDPGGFTLTDVELAVEPVTSTSVQIDPAMITAGKRATFGIVVSNVGNSAVTATGFAVDPEDLAEFTFEPGEVVVAPGREQVIEVTATGGRSWFGPPRPRTFTLGVEAERRVEAMATFVQRPRIGRWMITLLGLLTAAAVFALVLSRSFERVVDEARVSPAVLDAAFASESAGGVEIPAKPGSVSGSLVSSTTGQGFSGATAELFLPSDDQSPIASAATDDNGAFTFANLGQGQVLLKLSGSGVNQVWYSDSGVNAQTSVDATPIKVTLGEPTELPPIAIGGIPVPVEGAVDIDDPSGVTITLLAPGQVDPEAPGVVATVEVGPDGTFLLPDVPSPGAYTMVVSKPGFATTTRGIVLEPGQPLGGIEITLQPGNGRIEGTVSSSDGPLGGATLVASDGTTLVETVSLTEGDRGSFALRNLAVPGQYTVTVTRENYAPEARSVTLTELQSSARLDVQLLPSIGSVQGRVVINGQAARGLKVQITGGDVNRTTAVVSQGPNAGTYSFFGLPAPRTYTLTFSGSGTIAQVRVVDLDPAAGNQNQTGVDVSLSFERTTVQGMVTDVDGSPASQATVVLSNGEDDFTMLTSDEPSVGMFAFSDIAPGAYTLTASRKGTVDVVVLVNVSASIPVPPINVQLGQQASLSGTIIGFDPTVQQLTVKLYRPELFPVQSFETTQTDPQGNYTFPALDAPESFVVAVFTDPLSAQVLDSEIARTRPGQNTVVPTLDVSAPVS